MLNSGSKIQDGHKQNTELLRQQRTSSWPPKVGASCEMQDAPECGCDASSKTRAESLALPPRFFRPLALKQGSHSVVQQEDKCNHRRNADGNRKQPSNGLSSSSSSSRATSEPAHHQFLFYASLHTNIARAADLRNGRTLLQQSEPHLLHNRLAGLARKSRYRLYRQPSRSPDRAGGNILRLWWLALRRKSFAGRQNGDCNGRCLLRSPTAITPLDRIRIQLSGANDANDDDNNNNINNNNIDDFSTEHTPRTCLSGSLAQFQAALLMMSQSERSDEPILAKVSRSSLAEAVVPCKAKQSERSAAESESVYSTFIDLV